MATKPTPGGSDGTYGTELNEFLDVSLASDGKIADGAEQSTSAAPAADAELANKKYIDDRIAATTTWSVWSNQDDTPTAMAKDHAYLANANGFVRAHSAELDTADYLRGYTHNASDTVESGILVDSTAAVIIDQLGAIGFAVKSGEYFEITSDGPGTVTILWLSIGTAVAPTDQD